MNQNTFVGVDPASGDFECAFVRNGEGEATRRTFTIRVTELDQMIEWLQNERIDAARIATIHWVWSQPSVAARIDRVPERSEERGATVRPGGLVQQPKAS